MNLSWAEHILNRISKVLATHTLQVDLFPTGKTHQPQPWNAKVGDIFSNSVLYRNGPPSPPQPISTDDAVRHDGIWHRYHSNGLSDVGRARRKGFAAGKDGSAACIDEWVKEGIFKYYVEISSGASGFLISSSDNGVLKETLRIGAAMQRLQDLCIIFFWFSGSHQWSELRSISCRTSHASVACLLGPARWKSSEIRRAIILNL